MTLLSTSFQNNKVVISSPFPLLNHGNIARYIVNSRHSNFFFLYQTIGTTTFFYVKVIGKKGGGRRKTF